MCYRLSYFNQSIFLHYFTNTLLVRLIWGETNLKGVDFTEAILSRTKLGRANFTGAILHKTNLGETNLKGVNFTGAILKEANLNRANFDDADFSEVQYLDPSQVKLGCNWERANFSEEFKQKLAQEPDQNVDCSLWNKDL